MSGSAEVRLDNRALSLRAWLGDLWRHRYVLVMLASKDFRVRYKRAGLGISWAVGMPVAQSAVLVFVFSRVGRFGTGQGYSYPALVLGGMIAWLYVSSAVASATQAIVDGASLTDKVAFPRAVLALVPVCSNLVTLGVTALLLLIELPVVGAAFHWTLLLLIPAAALAMLFTAGLGLVLAALYVYFRDVRFIVQAVLLVWLYVTPIVYPAASLHGAGRWLDFNPLTGIVTLFQHAALGVSVGDDRSIVVSVIWTVALGLIAAAVYRRHERLFVDLL